MPKKSVNDTALALSSKKAMVAYTELSPTRTAVRVVSGIALACTASHWLAILWRNKTARRALAAGVSAAVACLAQGLEDSD